MLDCFSYEQIKNKMAASEEELFIVVQKYPVIFDKSNKGFHRKDVKKNVWKAVAKEFDFENGKY